MDGCQSCGSEVIAGARWCPICHANVKTPRLGRLSSPGKRLGAYFLDVMTPFFAFILVGGVAGFGAATGTDAGAGFGMLLGFSLVVAYIIWALMLFAKGTTPGKNLLGMYVMREDGTRAGFGTMLVREWIGKLISGFVLALGFLWILFDRDNQGWHDKLVSTYVVEKPGATQRLVPERA